MINVKELSKSTRTFVRREKARIRREITDKTELQKALNVLHLQFHKA
jgi:hypothetical protein